MRFGEIAKCRILLEYPMKMGRYNQVAEFEISGERPLMLRNFVAKMGLVSKITKTLPKLC